MSATLPHRGPFGRAEASHLWRRAGFGASAQTIERSVERGLDATLDELLARREPDAVLRAGVEPLLALGEVETLQAWWMALILSDRAPLVERMTLVWHDHFATAWDKVQDVRLMHAQNELFRDLGLGDFRALLQAVVQDPALLVWLDGERNRRGEPNENLARELLELFALGLGAYDEDDVAEVARALTGWRVEGRRAVFREADHDSDEKSILGRRAAFDARGAVEALLAHPACARHVARALLAELVRPEPDEAEVGAWADVLLAEDWDVGRTLRRLLGSELFFSEGARSARIRGPVELVAGTCIALECSPAPASLARAAAAMGQALFRPPSVKGWDGGRGWIHAGSWIARHDWLCGLVLGDGAGEASLAGCDSRQAVVERALGLLLPDMRERRYALTLQAAADACEDLECAARRVLALVLTSPEYHLT